MKANRENRPKCNKCDLPCQLHGKASDGAPRWKLLCRGCNTFKVTGKRYKKKPYHKYSQAYYSFKKGICEDCGFVAKHKCQLDVDHIDGDRDNNSLINLKTLCANCHRLKTLLNKDCWAKQYRKAV